MKYRVGSLPQLVTALAASLLLATGCNGVQTLPDEHAVTIMTFNVENLFDNVDDPGKNDRTFLPLAAKQNDEHRAACALIEVDRWRDQCLNWDWSDEMLEQKLEATARAILQVGNGSGADIIALQEIENLSILERLRKDYLADAGYLPGILIEGTDARGIDVAFLTRLPQAAPAVLHPITFTGIPEERVADTRGILEVTFKLPDGTLLTGYSVHFPAPFHPTEMRVAAYEQLNRLRDALPDDRHVFAAGDFNTTSAEDQRENMLERFARPHWTVAHDLGCGDDCRGTSYYARDGSWSFLDTILWSPPRRGADATWAIRADSVQLAKNSPGQTTNDGTPARFDPVTGDGVSDHWPLVMTIETN